MFDRFTVIRERFFCDKPLDPRDIGWLIDEVEHLRGELSHASQELHRLSLPARIET